MKINIYDNVKKEFVLKGADIPLAAGFIHARYRSGEDLSRYDYSLYTQQVTRVEVIDDNVRVFHSQKNDNRVKLSLQDDDRTMKIFISKK